MSQPVSRVLSWTVIHLGPASPRASSNLPEPGAGHTTGFLFGLAPGGVYPATDVTTGAVRSYRTISPLPRHWRGGIFSVALSVDSHRPGVTWHPALRSPDFPPRNEHAATVRLTHGKSRRMTRQNQSMIEPEIADNYCNWGLAGLYIECTLV